MLDGSDRSHSVSLADMGEALNFSNEPVSWLRSRQAHPTAQVVPRRGIGRRLNTKATQL